MVMSEIELKHFLEENHVHYDIFNQCSLILTPVVTLSCQIFCFVLSYPFCSLFSVCFVLLCFIPQFFVLQPKSKTPSPKTSINNNNNDEKPQVPLSLDFLRSAPKSTPESGSYQYQMRRRLVIDPSISFIRVHCFFVVCKV